MKKVKVFQSRLFCAVLLNFIALLIFSCIFHPYFETNDDNLMALISDGAMAGYSSHLVFINIIYGQLLVFLHMICPDVNWYTGLLFILLFFSFTAVSYVLMNLKWRKKGYLISLVILSWFGYYSYVVLQFTRVAGISSAAGVLLIFFGLDHERGKKKVLVWMAGAFLALAGSLLRFEMFFMCSVFLAGLGLWRCMNFYKTGGLKKAVGIWKYLLPYILVLMLGVGLKTIDTLAYNAQEDWKEYREYNTLRSELMDYGFPAYEENKAVYKELGISEKDVQYFLSWNFADPEKFNKDTLEKLVALKEKKAVNLQFFVDFVWEMARGLFYEKSFILFGLVFLLYCIEWKKNLFSLSYAAVMVLFFQLYFYFQGRFLFERVDMPLWFCGVVFLVYTGHQSLLSENISISRYLIAAALVFVMNGEYMMRNLVTDSETELQKEQKIMLDNMARDEETLYCTNVSSLEQAYDIRHRMEKNSMTNVYFLGGWLYNAPLTEQIKERYGITNPFKECIDNSNILIVDTYYAEATEDYIQRNYDKTAQMLKIKAVQGQAVYQVVSEDYHIEEKEERPLDESINCNLWGSRTSDSTVRIQGYMYQKNTDSFSQRFYIRVTDTRSGKISYKLALQTENYESSEVWNGKYGGIDQEVEIPTEDQKFLNIEVILETENDDWYAVPVETIQ